jgi:hypothetical protein
LAVVSGYLVDETPANEDLGDDDTDGVFDFNTWFTTGVLVSGDIESAGTNGSVAGWGVDNNGFENTNELFFFDFGSQATSDPDAGGPFVPPVQGPDVAGDPPEVQLPNISTATFEFINYSSGAGDTGDDIAYVVHYTDGSFDSGFVPDNAIDGDVQWKFTADAGKFIADIQFFSGANPSGSEQDLPPGKIDLVSVGVQSTSLDVDLDFTVTLTDYDGDQVQGSFTINVDQANSPSTPSAEALVIKSSVSDTSDTSSLSLLSSDSFDSQRTMSAANNNSVLLGAIAAAGLGISSAAAASGFDTGANHMMLDNLSIDYGSATAQAFAIDNSAMVIDGLGIEGQDILRAGDAVESTVQRAIVDKLSLTDSAGDQGQAPTALLQGTELHAADFAQSTLTSAAVGMPSAEMLAGGLANGNAISVQPQGTAEVGRVLLDALAGGGGGGPDIDAVIDAAANQAGGGGAAALDALASQGFLDVSAWHTGGFTGFSAIHGSPMMEPMLHHDAVVAA